MNERKPTAAMLGEFDSAAALLEAAREAKRAGYTRLEAYTPVHVSGLAAELGARPTRLPAFVLLGGLLGAVLGYFLQFYTNAIDYPFNVGGRPLNSWPAFVPVTFELAILGAALAAVLGMLGRNGLPQPYHPVFNAPRFALASRDRFFLAIEAEDPRFCPQAIRELFQRVGASDIAEVGT